MYDQKRMGHQALMARFIAEEQAATLELNSVLESDHPVNVDHMAELVRRVAVAADCREVLIMMQGVDVSNPSIDDVVRPVSDNDG